MRASIVGILALVLSLVGFFGCDEGAQTSTDGNTNWLRPCAVTSECGAGLVCECGICTRSCSVASDCEVGNGKAVCAEGSALSGVCSSVPPTGGICVAVCRSSSDCGGGGSCRDGLCSATDLDAGEDSSTRDQSVAEAAPPQDAFDGRSHPALEGSAGEASVESSLRDASDADPKDASPDGGGVDVTVPPTPEGGTPPPEGGDVVVPCPDDDRDGVCNAVDVCPGFDDRLDDDGDKRPNGCEPVLLLDINTATESSDPTSFAELGGNVYFGAFNGDPYEGAEVWSMPVGGGGTSRVTNVNAGDLSRSIRFLTTLGDRLFFFDEGPSDAAAWVTKPPGPPVRVGGGPWWSIRKVVTTSDRVFFLVATAGDHQLWTSDGTEAGTLLLYTYQGGVESTLTAAGQLAYFTSYNRPGAVDLWRTDGTVAGTLRITQGLNDSLLGPDYSLPELDGRLYFVLWEDKDSGGPIAVWSTDGSVAGTRRAFSSPTDPRFTGALWASRTHLFIAVTSPQNGSVWATTGEGVSPVPLDVEGTVYSGGPSSYVAPVGDVAYVSATTGIWRCDGSSACDHVYVSPPSRSEEAEIISADTGAYFLAAPEGATSQHLFHVDAAGTTDVTPAGLDLGLLNPQGFSPQYLLGVTSGDRLYFLASTPEHGVEPWVSDGTAQGTHELVELNTTTKGSSASSFSSARSGGPVVFSAKTNATGREPWIVRDDGRTTSMLADTAPGATDGFSNQWLALDEYEFFVAQGTNGTLSVYRVDANGGTVELPYDANGAPSAQAAFERSSSVVFVGSSPITSPAMLSMPLSNLTQPGPSIAGAAFVGVWPSFQAVEWKGDMWFLTGRELERVVGTTLSEYVTDAPFGTLLALGDSLFFSGINQSQLYRLDAVGAAPTLVMGASYVGNAVAFKDTAYFSALLPGDHQRFYRTTASGFEEFADIGVTTHPLVVGNRLFFVDHPLIASSPPPGGRALWVTDGTGIGTQKILDGVDDSHPMVAYKGLAYFAATDNTHGTELWRSDGTPAGTFMEADIYPGTYGSSPTDLYAAPDGLYLTATTPGHGAEPCVLRR